MANDTTVIAKGARVRGRILGSATLEIHGHVEGEILVQGDLTVGDGGMVGSDLSGRRVVVRGAVRGDVTGDEAVVLEDGAKVVGDVRAPRIAIAPGALVRGYVETSGAAAGASRGRAVPAARSSGTSIARAVPRSNPASAGLNTAPKPAPAPSLPRGATLAGAKPPNDVPARKKAPPPPIVPALKKGAKGALAKKR